MRKAAVIILAILLVPVFLIASTVVHEVGHTVLARMLGDPASVFYLAKIDEHGTCLGCNIYDSAKLSWGGNLVVSLGGLLATQLVAVAALLLLQLRIERRPFQNILRIIALGFAFLDVAVQVIQGLLYNLSRETWQTGVDLVDVMLLLQAKTGASQLLLKGLLLAATIAYLSGFVWLYRRQSKHRPAVIPAKM